MTLAIFGAGAFGTALAINFAQSGKPVSLVGRDAERMKTMATTRLCDRLPGVELPELVKCSDDVSELAKAKTVLFAVPTQTLSRALTKVSDQISADYVVACCKGVDLATLKGPTDILLQHLPKATPAILTGPSFAADIARGLPTALTLACVSRAKSLQEQLTTDTLRIYQTQDTKGAELGGALKNVVAIGAGIAIGAGLGDSARASLMTRGFRDMQRFADAFGADPQTLNGLSGFGDLTLTCTSELSRNFRFGKALGAEGRLSTQDTVEGVATSAAVKKLALQKSIELPVCETIADVLEGKLTVQEALGSLMSRPLKDEFAE